jgi:hypothetical protein
LAVRIGTRSALGGSREPDLSEGFALLQAGVASARAAGLEVRQVQLDFDCPERLLSAYAARVRAFKATNQDLSVTVTALPSWLDARGCAELFAAVDGFTLQVHATQRPNARAPTPLLSSRQALAWVEQAQRFRRPFRVALPTYAYVAGFARSGTFLGVQAEGREPPTATVRTQLLPADPAEVAATLAALRAGRYPWVRGVDWFRLAFPGDRQNWTRAGFAQVLKGEVLAARCQVEPRLAGALVDLVVVNPTPQPLALPVIKVRWSRAGWVAADAAEGWTVPAAEAHGQVFAVDPRAGFLAPAERRVVGWLRLSASDPTLHVETVGE